MAIEAYTELLEQATADDNIVGFFLAGSRARGTQTEYLDWDVYLITKDGVADEYKARFKQSILKPKVYSLSAFESYAAVGSDTEWARHGFSYLTVQIDKLNGGIQTLVNAKASLSSEIAGRLIDRSAGAFINSVYRSIKNHRDGRAAPSRLDAMETIPAFLTAVFALEGRLKPYNKYLEWELENHPLKLLHIGSNELLEAIKKVGQTGDIAAQQKLLAMLCDACSERGYGYIIERWGSKLAFMLEYKK